MSNITNKILIVDDDLKILSLIERILKKEPYELYTADTEKKALNYVRRHTFDLVISDFVLKETAGILLFDKIKKKQPNIKTILMSGGFRPNKNEIKMLRIDAFLPKPFDLHKLKSTVQKVLKK